MTKAAAREIASRTGTAPVEETDLDTPQPTLRVGTLHSLCYHGLHLQGELIGDSPKGRKQWNLWLQAQGPKAPDYTLNAGSSGGRTTLDEPESQGEATQGDDLLSQYNLERHKLSDREKWPKAVRGFATWWERWLEEAGGVDFTGLLERGCDELYSAPGIPDVLLGDEAQDWSHLETKLFRDRWGRSAETVILCGDPDQCIYDWRGADPRMFLDHPVPEANERVLEQSYRVPRAVHGVASVLLESVRDRAPVVYKPRDDDGQVLQGEVPLSAVDFLVDDIERAEQEGSVMILARCAYQLQALVKTLRARGIPFGNPYRPAHAGWNPLKRRGKTNAIKQLLSFLTDDEWTTEDLITWLPLMRASGDLAVLVRGAKKAIKTLSDPWTSAEFLSFFQNETDAVAALDKDPLWLLERCTEEHRKRLAYAARVVANRGREALERKPRITLGTIHSVKGGEADTVFLAPDLSPASQETYDTNPDAELRVFYVAVTRARHRLVVLPPSGRWVLPELLW